MCFIYNSVYVSIPIPSVENLFSTDVENKFMVIEGERGRRNAIASSNWNFLNLFIFN